MKHLEANETVGTGIQIKKTVIGINGEIHKNDRSEITKEEYNSVINDWNKKLKENNMAFAGDAIATTPEKIGKENLNFGEAIEMMKSGFMVQRAGWNSKGLFIFMQVPSQVPVDIIPKMTSLPQSVKDEFKKRFSSETEMYAGFTIKYQNQIAMVYPDNTINGWAPSSSDTLAVDWMILD